MTDIEKLAARVAALTGPCRETDAEIAVVALGWITRPPRYDGDSIAYGYVENGSTVFPGNGAGNSLVRRYTASLDAAMTLVPKGEEWGVSQVHYDQGMAPAAFVNLSLEQSWGKTPALALTAASLRALAAQEKEQDA